MIRTEQEYRFALDSMSEGLNHIASERERLKQAGYDEESIARGLDPLIAFNNQIREEISYYETLREGHLPPACDLSELGHLLIALRIFKRWSQTQLAEALQVSRAQVCRDERNEYFGITLERASKIVAAMGLKLTIKSETLTCIPQALDAGINITPATPAIKLLSRAAGSMKMG